MFIKLQTLLIHDTVFNMKNASFCKQYRKRPKYSDISENMTQLSIGKARRWGRQKIDCCS